MTDVSLSATALLAPGMLFTLAELHGMKLDGVLVPVLGHTFRPAATPETPELRAAAVSHHIPACLVHRAVVAQLSAAWVYGCAPPPDIFSLVVGNDGNSVSAPPFCGCIIRQVRLDPLDVLELGAVPVTSPLRTALDVARTAPLPVARAALTTMSRNAVLQCPLGRIRQALAAAVHVPGKRRAQELLENMIDDAHQQLLRSEDAGA